ncbi:MAG: hypothetical protein PHH82_02075 [Candidatus ainarchaeum sp.]|nr:hypothetical protein [Candidatus ainarchaeum sp.]
MVEFIKRMVDRNRTKKFGERMPDEAMTVRILGAIQNKVTYPEKDLMKVYGHNPWEALMTNFGKVNPEMSLRRKPIVSRVATKYALDAAGLSVKYDSQKRVAVHKVMAGVVDKTERMIRAIGAQNVGIEAQIKIVNDAALELNRILGEKAAKAFIEAYTDKVFRLYRLVRNLPVKLE